MPGLLLNDQAGVQERVPGVLGPGSDLVEWVPLLTGLLQLLKEFKIFFTILWHFQIDCLFVCFIRALHHFQQSFSHIAKVSRFCRELNAHF